jgi:hypothetical protein
MEGFRTHTNMGHGDSTPPEVVSDEEIERAIAEIQDAIKKVSK